MEVPLVSDFFGCCNPAHIATIVRWAICDVRERNSTHQSLFGDGTFRISCGRTGTVGDRRAFRRRSTADVSGTESLISPSIDTDRILVLDAKNHLVRIFTAVQPRSASVPTLERRRVTTMTHSRANDDTSHLAAQRRARYATLGGLGWLAWNLDHASRRSRA